MDKIIVKCDEKTIKIKSMVCLSNKVEYNSLLGVQESERGETLFDDHDFYFYAIKKTPINAFTLRYLLKGLNVGMKPETVEELKELADRIKPPVAYLAENERSIEVRIPFIENYKAILNNVNAYPLGSGAYRFPIFKLQDFELLNDQNESKFPKIAIQKKVLSLTRESIPGFDGTIESLKNIPIGVLNVVKANSQSVKSLKKSRSTLEEKLNDFGLATLYDLVFWTPRRYIDKTEPQLVNDLVNGESTTLIGEIVGVGDFAKGINFTIRLADHNEVNISFFGQQWLKAKFKVGMEVLVTGKVKFWHSKLQISGVSIEPVEQANLLPIVPIYNQSQSKGITTTFILAAQREMFSRMNNKLHLPKYFNDETSYYDLLRELHLPTDIRNYKESINQLAYYELVYMQLLMQFQKEGETTVGVELSGELHDYQQQVIDSLPFTLTNSQQIAVDKLNKKLASNIASNTLLSAEVGSGKSIVSQLACLRAVDSGKQAVLVGPTDVLAKQLFDTFVKALAEINKIEEKVKIRYIGSQRIPAKEKRELLKGIADGEIDILVGTHSIFSDSIVYKDLGFIAIDEQQKFGVEQRDVLLGSRKDGRTPHILLQSATPIPRSTAQIYFGDIDVLQLKDKPAGRLPIETVWVEEDPITISEQVINGIWSDIYEEAEKGHQSFIIAPMVKESTKIDAASVEKIYKDVSSKALSGLNVAYVHGQMKIPEQRKIMEEFRNGEYDVLVASTVIEVGVDIPNATRMVIVSADRLGASSLHQIRGRIGRNSLPSKCYLVSTPKTDNGRERLQSLVDNADGFEVAKNDLLLRGQGTMFSTVQSGKSEMMFATLTKHGKYIKQAKQQALEILQSEYRDEAIKDATLRFKDED